MWLGFLAATSPAEFFALSCEAYFVNRQRFGQAGQPQSQANQLTHQNTDPKMLLSKDAYERILQRRQHALHITDEQFRAAREAGRP